MPARFIGDLETRGKSRLWITLREPHALAMNQDIHHSAITILFDAGAP